MSKEKRLEREFMLQDKRFDHAKAQAEKHIRRKEAWISVMNKAMAEQRRIIREIKEVKWDE